MLKSKRAFLIAAALGLLTFAAFFTLVLLSARSPGIDQAAMCQNNLNQIDAAINQWAFDNKKPEGTPVTTNDILPYLKYGLPRCPIGGSYILTKVGIMPHCSMPTNEHKIVY